MNTDSSARDPETFAIIGAAMEVRRELHHGFLEVIYGDALAVEFANRRIPFEREKLLQVRYKGGILPSYYKADFVCFGTVLIECKALRSIGGAEQAQVLNYLRITGLTRAMLLNFGAYESLRKFRQVRSRRRGCPPGGRTTSPVRFPRGWLP